MKIWISTVLVFLASASVAQITGYTIDRSGDTLQVVFKKNQFISGHFNELAFQENPKYLFGSKKKRVELKEISELGFEIDGESYIYHVLPLNQGLYIRRLLLSGNVSVYSELSQGIVHDHGGITTGSGIQTKYIVRQGNGIPFRPKALALKKSLLKHLQPCSTFEEILGTQSFGMRDLLFLIESYNKDCS